MNDITNTEIDLDVLLIENLADLDLAAQRLSHGVEPAVYAAIDTEFAKFVAGNGWVSKIDSYNETWFGPRNWLLAAAESTELDAQDKCQFNFEGLLTDTYAGELGEDIFLLTRLLGLGNGKAGFRWRQFLVTKGKWRKLLREHSIVMGTLEKSGFMYEETEGTFYLTFQLDKDELVKAFRDEAPENALGPLRAALQTVLNSTGEFEKLLSALTAPGQS